MKPVLRVAVLALVCAVGGCARDLEPQSALAESRELISSGESGEARVLLKNLLVKHPEVSAARVLLARIALDAGDPRAAEDELAGLDRAALQDGDSQAVRWETDLALGRAVDVLSALQGEGVKVSQSKLARLRSVALRMTGAPADGIGDLRAAVRANPNDADLIVELAMSLGAIGNLQQAEAELDSYLLRQPAQADVLLARGEMLLRNGAADKALADLQGARKAAGAGWPLTSRLSADVMIGDALLAAGRVTEAKQHLAAVEKEYPGAIGTQLLLSRIAVLEGRTGDGVDVLQKLSEAAPGNARIQYLLVDALIRSGNTARATELLERRTQSAPDDVLARRLLARLMLDQSRPDQVVKVLGGAADDALARDSETDSLLSAARLAQERAGAAIVSSQAQLAANPSDPTARANLAEAYLQNGEPKRALGILQQGPSARQAPNALAVEMGAQLALGNDREVNLIVNRAVEDSGLASEALLAAADVAQRGGRVDAASRLLDRVLQSHPGNPGALLRRANLEFVERRYEKARIALQDLIKANPADAYARLALARVAEAEGQPENARKALQEAVKAMPAALEPSLMLAGLELRADQHEAAARVLDQLISSAPKDGVAANAGGMLLLGARRLDEARTRFRLAVDQNGSEARYAFNLGRTQVALDDRAAAQQSFLASVASRPDWLDANVAAVRVSLANGDRAAARRVSDALAAKLPESPVAWLLVGEVAGTERRFADASRAFAQSYAKQPTSAAALGDHRARALGGLGRPDLPLMNWLAREPRDIAARRSLSDFYLRNSADRDSAAQLEQLIVEVPNDVVALNNLAWLLADRDRPRAETLARRAHAIAPANPAIADTLGWVLIQNGKYPEAKDVLAMASGALPDDASVRYHYALALARSGDRVTARVNVEQALASKNSFSGRDAAQSLFEELSR